MPEGAALMSRVLVLIAVLLIVPAGAASAGVTQTNTCPIYMSTHGHPRARLRHPPAPPPPPYRRHHR
jgi:hypothetical protein